MRKRHSRLRKLVRQRKNDELYLLTVTLNAKTTDNNCLLVDSCGNTIVHLAAKYGNIELLKCLFRYRHFLNVLDPSGMTPLMIAINNKQFEVANLILDEGADIFIKNLFGVAVLEMAVRQQVPGSIIKKLIDIFIKFNFCPDMIAIMLERAGCSLKYALSFNDTMILKTLLERKLTISSEESTKLIRCTLNNPTEDSVANLMILINYGFGHDVRKDMFLQEIIIEVECLFPSLNTGYLKKLMRYLMDADALDHDFAIYFIKIFCHGKKSAVKLLLDCEVHTHFKQRFRRNILPHLFGNRKVNAIKLTRDRDFEVNSIGCGDYTALHCAVRANLINNVKFLLENGSNPNLADDAGMTPIFACDSSKCIMMLLEYGADIQIQDSDGLNLLDIAGTSVINYVLAHLALLEAADITIKPYMHNRLETNRKFNYLYTKCQAQLTWMKQRKIFQRITLFHALVDKPENIVRYVAKLQNKAELREWYEEYPLEKYYFSKLKNNLKKVVKMYQLRRQAAWFICQIMRLCDPEHLVVQEIVGYLTFEDLLFFA
ncbi:ankyrin-3-like [Phymastichus coffea]|uniref:ankyrin-3-like n=1 Tax=Phymastichus coffea TaxID=108790 RepID=UPI00273C5E48|nr:ankyrin-3-like [Phymastichus coffea]